MFMRMLNFFQTEWKLFESLVENREHSDFLFGTFVATQVFTSETTNTTEYLGRQPI